MIYFITNNLHHIIKDVTRSSLLIISEAASCSQGYHDTECFQTIASLSERESSRSCKFQESIPASAFRVGPERGKLINALLTSILSQVGL